ncbi:MAG TPA: MFS transporter [Nocardioidaceae bacterium]|nr:MFS transporter [Nocardioidaceae bacterium]
MITTYRRVLGLPGAFAMSLSGLVARLPISMISLGLVVLISGETGSYSLAGAVTASYIVASAVCSIFLARLMDQFGQAAVILVSLMVSMVALVLTMVAVEEHWASPAAHLLAAVSGATLPLVGSAVRARWSHLVSDKALLQTAFAVEAVIDEVVFVLGPTLVTLLATGVHPLAGLTAAIVAAVTGTLAFVSLRSTEPPPSGRHERGHAEPMGWTALAPLAVAAACMGILFGGCEVATVAFADEHHHKAIAGPLLAIWSLGSLLSGVAVGLIRWKASNATRFQRALLALGTLLVPLPFIDNFWLLAAALFLAGWCISPGLIAAVSMIAETVPRARLTEGMAVFSTGLMAGVAPGAAIAGWVVDRHGASASYWVPVAAGFIGAALAFATSALRRPAPTLESHREPVDV